MRRIRARAGAVSGASAVVWALVALACEGSLDTDVEGDDAEVAADAGTAREDDAGTDLDASSEPATDAGSAGTSDGGGGAVDAGGGDELVPVFVAQGYAGRTTISCDDGRTWVADRSLDDSLRCFQGDLDCDHHPGRAKGVVYTKGWFVATYGWGPPGSVQRSRDGVSWETTLEDTTFGGIAALDDVVMLGARSVRVSDDEGATWSDPIGSELEGWNVRRAGAAPQGGGRLLLVGDAGDVTLSSDGGATWWRPDTLPGSCGRNIQNDGGVASIGDAIVIVGGDGSVCRSTDAGRTWTEHSVGGSVSSSEVVSTGSELMVWGGGRVYRSSDGASWSSTSLSPSGVDIGAVARSAEGTFVAVNGGWNRWYEDQRFYRSTDGVTWSELPQDAYRRGHPILQIEAGWAVPSEACPAP